MKAKQKFVPIVFVPTSLRKPPQDGEYLCVVRQCFGSHYITSLNYVKKVGLFNVYVDPDTGKADTSTAINVTYWASAKFISDTLKLAMTEEDNNND